MRKFKVGDTVTITGHPAEYTMTIDGKLGIIVCCFGETYRVKVPKVSGEWYLHERDLKPYIPKVIEVTMSDIEQKFGCKVKIVGER